MGHETGLPHDHDHSPISRDHHQVEPSVGDQVGEGVGGIGGTLAGAAIGSAAGPIGTLIGGIAGAVGGWWAGRSVSEAATHYTKEDDAHYRTHFESDTARPADVDFDHARTGYAAGHLAGLNPDYQGRDWDGVSRDIRSGWREGEHGSWDRMEASVRHGWEHARHRLGDLAENTGDKIENATDHVGGAVERAGDRIETRTDRMG
jgi:hypothetical protein